MARLRHQDREPTNEVPAQLLGHVVLEHLRAPRHEPHWNLVCGLVGGHLPLLRAQEAKPPRTHKRSNPSVRSDQPEAGRSPEHDRDARNDKPGHLRPCQALEGVASVIRNVQGPYAIPYGAIARAHQGLRDRYHQECAEHVQERRGTPVHCGVQPHVRVRMWVGPLLAKGLHETGLKVFPLIPRPAEPLIPPAVQLSPLKYVCVAHVRMDSLEPSLHGRLISTHRFSTDQLPEPQYPL
mmetsp:Transcript_4722/g.13934  ORF Transcript_4722/g.13934 Transcript_4722/m.13934 type:complete len:238 (+) Transcript_4722:405-1118(+)